MLFYIMIIIIILIIIYIPKKNNNERLENYKVFDINRDVLSKTNDLAKYLLLNRN